MTSPALVERNIARKPEIESTLPLINIVFLLLIFFLVAGTLQTPKNKSIAPPKQAITFDAVEFLPSEWVYTASDGSLSYNDAPLLLSSLEPALKDGKAVLYADEMMSGAHLTRILESFEAAGCDGVMLVTEQVRD